MKIDGFVAWWLCDRFHYLAMKIKIKGYDTNNEPFFIERYVSYKEKYSDDTAWYLKVGAVFSGCLGYTVNEVEIYDWVNNVMLNFNTNFIIQYQEVELIFKIAFFYTYFYEEYKWGEG